MARIRIETDADWRALRSRHVGASEVAALFGVHPQITRWELWQRKAGYLDEPALDDNQRVFWGQTLEPAIAQGAAARQGWTTRKVHTYWTCDETPGMGASLDYEIIKDDRGAGVLEIKTVDGLQYRDWDDGEPPLAYMLQLQQQLAVTGRAWGAVAVLVGGNDLKVFEYERHEATIRRLRTEITAFWRSLAEGAEPQPDFARDADRIAELKGDPPPRTVDLSGHNRILQIIEAHDVASAMKNDWERGQKAAKAELLHALGDATHAWLPDGRVLEIGVVRYKAATVERPAGSYRKSPKVMDADKAKLPEASSKSREPAPAKPRVDLNTAAPVF